MLNHEGPYNDSFLCRRKDSRSQSVIVAGD